MPDRSLRPRPSDSSGPSIPRSWQYSKKDIVGIFRTAHLPVPLSAEPFSNTGLADPVAAIRMSGLSS